MSASERPAPPEFQLRAFGEADIPTLVAWLPSEELLVQWAGPLYGWPFEGDQIRRHHANVVTAQRICEPFKAVAADGAMVGYLELNRIDHRHRNAALSRIIVAPDLRGRGLGAAMVRRVLSRAFGEQDLHRIELSVYTHNQPAVRCYEGVGFVREGLARDVVRVGSRYWSEYRMSILEDDWRALKSP